MDSPREVLTRQVRLGSVILVDAASSQHSAPVLMKDCHSHREATSGLVSEPRENNWPLISIIITRNNVDLSQPKRCCAPETSRLSLSQASSKWHRGSRSRVVLAPRELNTKFVCYHCCIWAGTSAIIHHKPPTSSSSRTRSRCYCRTGESSFLLSPSTIVVLASVFQ